MSVIRQLIAKLTADTGQFDRGMQQSAKHVQGFTATTSSSLPNAANAFERLGLRMAGIPGPAAGAARSVMSLAASMGPVGIAVAAGVAALALLRQAFVRANEKIAEHNAELRADISSMIAAREEAEKTQAIFEKWWAAKKGQDELGQTTAELEESRNKVKSAEAEAGRVSGEAQREKGKAMPFGLGAMEWFFQGRRRQIESEEEMQLLGIRKRVEAELELQKKLVAEKSVLEKKAAQDVHDKKVYAEKLALADALRASENELAALNAKELAAKRDLAEKEAARRAEIEEEYQAEQQRINEQQFFADAETLYEEMQDEIRAREAGERQDFMAVGSSRLSVEGLAGSANTRADQQRANLLEQARLTNRLLERIEAAGGLAP